jgi:small-conductance mechanosensitive channel
MAPSKLVSFLLQSHHLSPETDQRRGIRPPRPRVAIPACILTFIFFSAVAAHAASESSGRPQEADVSIIENPGSPVKVDGRPILSVYSSVGGFSSQERAEHIRERIIAVAKTTAIPTESIRAEDRGVWTEIIAGNDLIMGITELDARAAARERSQLASENVEVIRYVVKQYREEHTFRRLLRGGLNTVVATVALALSLLLLFWTRRIARARLSKRLACHRPEGPPSFSRRVLYYCGRPFVRIVGAVFWILVLALLQAYGTVVLRFFPSTRYTSYQITNWLFSKFEGFGKTVVAYLPNLVLVVIICIATSYLIQASEYLFAEIRAGRLTIRGFYPDWAEPTAKLVRILIVAAAAVVVFPYLPGSQSPAFRGISVFLGVLVSLGSSSSVAHVVAGTILTYMRAFQIGDFVRIGQDVGEVVEKTLLVTRIRTQKMEVITIPNGTVLGGVVVNYSAESRGRGVIFHTVVTIGYNAPWRQVHEMLLSAALATKHVLRDPPPFVLQTALNDFYVAYELNAYTDKPLIMQYVYSELHQNIQDKFNEAGVEINSPHYTALRDGNRTTVPGNYLPEDYKTPVFGVQEVHNTQPLHEKAAAHR